MGVEPTARRFQTCFFIRNTNPFQFYPTAHSKEKKATFLESLLEKESSWGSYYIFVEEPANRPFNFLPWAESLPPLVDSSTLNLDSQIMKMNKTFSKGSFIWMWCVLMISFLLYRGSILTLVCPEISTWMTLYSFIYLICFFKNNMRIKILFTVSDMVMNKFFQFPNDVSARERTPLRAAAIAISPTQAVTNKKVAEIRLSKASSSCWNAPEAQQTQQNS